jgi:polar amino acid transport system substrate-binding protein
MPTQAGTLQMLSPRIAWGSAAAALLVTAALVAAPVRAADKIGDCELFGEKGQFTITPAVPGQLTVEFNPPAPGWWNGDSIDQIRDGFEYCLAANIAYRLGLDKVSIVPVAWDALVAGQTRDYDLALSQASITNERKKVINFSVPYFSSDIGVLVKKGKELDATSIKSAQLGVQQATTAQTFVEQQLKPTVPVKVFPDTPSMFTGLQANQADAVLTDTSLVLQQATMSGGRLEVIGQYATGEVYGAIYPKGSPNAGTLDQVIQSLIDDGTVAKLSAKYLADVWGIDPASIPYFEP